MEFVFWASSIFIIYTYIGYPVVIWFIARLKETPDAELSVSEWPEVAIIVPVHNEIEFIKRKIENLIDIEYPKTKLSICVASDGSDDGTNDIVEEYKNVQLIAYYPRQGKPTAINTAASKLTAEVLVFTDARQIVDVMAVKHLIASLLKENIGAVSGELVQSSGVSETGKSVGLYWKYEKWIRKSESKVHSVAGVTGALYAIRKVDFTPIPEDTLLDDFEIPIKLLKSGKRILLESGAKISDLAQEDAAIEKKRKIRTLAGNYQSLIRNKWLFLPIVNPIWWQFVSHKVFRLLVPYALAGLVLSSALLSGLIYSVSFIAQTIFYLTAMVGYFFPSTRRFRIVSIIHVFCELNLAVILALFEFFGKTVEVKWEKTS